MLINLYIFDKIHLDNALNCISFNWMNTKEVIKKDGQVVEILMGGMFRVELTDKTSAICTISNILRKNNVRVSLGDKVQVEFSPYDLTRGRISYRFNREIRN